MASSSEYYTYAYLRKSNGTPYYIGKGKGRRAFVKHKGISTPKDRSKIIFLKENITEEEAIKHEIYMITILGRKDIGTGILLNRTREEVAREHITRKEVDDRIEKFVDHVDQRFNRLEAKIDALNKG
jgi:hypothetical protein